MWCNDLESNAAEPREISRHVSPEESINFVVQIFDRNDWRRNRSWTFISRALSLYPAHSNIKIRVQRPRLEDDTVRCAYPTVDPRLRAVLHIPTPPPCRRVSMDRFCSPIEEIFRSVCPTVDTRPALCNRRAPTRLSFARKPQPSWWWVGRSTCAPFGIPERRACTRDFNVWNFLFFSSWKAILTGKVWRLGDNFIFPVTLARFPTLSFSKLGIDIMYLYFGEVCIFRFVLVIWNGDE